MTGSETAYRNKRTVIVQQGFRITVKSSSWIRAEAYTPSRGTFGAFTERKRDKTWGNFDTAMPLYATLKWTERFNINSSQFLPVHCIHTSLNHQYILWACCWESDTQIILRLWTTDSFSVRSCFFVAFYSSYKRTYMKLQTFRPLT